ncbi:MAG: hypothetical protein DCF16_01695 [Alphaproteobacteria bacterium]|nr:MAG: hypothetical protein DCF16_01695 [Alphaproteobacteria bacterium]
MKAKSDKELKALAKAYATIFAGLAAEKKKPSEIAGGLLGMSFGPAGFIEYTPELQKALSEFVQRAAKLIGPAGTHEKAISQIAAKAAHTLVAVDAPIDEVASGIVEAVIKAGSTSFVFVAPNRLMHFTKGVAEVRIGNVRAMFTDAFAEERAKTNPDDAIAAKGGSEFKLVVAEQKTWILMDSLCWVVEVDAAKENVDEEAAWLIDVAISFLRLHHTKWEGLFPSVGECEPHPIHPPIVHKESVKFTEENALAAESRKPAWYEITEAVVDLSKGAAFMKKAALVSAPPAKSLAERVSQGLGWLTRGRRATDRAERLLFFFTAIEALLSREDKTAPVVQTIARHAAVLWTDNNETRKELSARIRKLYETRSALVHTGNRAVLWSASNNAQILAEALYFRVMKEADLATSFETFCSELSACSFGLPWKPKVEH